MSDQHTIGAEGREPNALPDEINWQDAILDSSNECKNCSADLGRNPYCARCGQRRLTSRLSLGDIVKQTFVRILNLETGLLRTLRLALVDTGTLAKNYCSGRQKPFVNPLALFFLAAALQLISLWFIESQMRTMLVNNFAKNNIKSDNPKLAEFLDGDLANTLADSYLLAIQQGYTYAALLCFCVPLAVLLKWLHSFRRCHFRLGETLTFALYTCASMLFVTAIATQIVFRISSSLQAFVGPLAYLIICMRAHTNFFPNGWASRLLTLLALTISCGIFFTSIIGLFVISTLAQIIWKMLVA